MLRQAAGDGSDSIFGGAGEHAVPRPNLPCGASSHAAMYPIVQLDRHSNLSDRVRRMSLVKYGRMVSCADHRRWLQPVLFAFLRARFVFTLGTTQPLVKLQRNPVRPIVAQSAFPNDRNSPTAFQQLVIRTSVPLDVGPELRLPEVRPGRWVGCIGAPCMTVPEAAVHKADSCELTEDKVWRSREISIMETESETAGMQCATENQFGFRVPAADLRHHARSALSIHYVGHQLSCPSSEVRDRTDTSQDTADNITENRFLFRPASGRGSGVSLTRHVMPVSSATDHRWTCVRKAPTIARCFLSSRDLFGVQLSGINSPVFRP